MICECDNEYPSGYRGTFQHFYSRKNNVIVEDCQHFFNSKDHILRENPINIKNSSTQSEDVNYTNMCLHRFLGTFSVKRCSERAVATT